MECPVCFDDMETLLQVKGPCAHVVCFECVTKLQAPQCPLCRAFWPRRRQANRRIASHVVEAVLGGVVPRNRPQPSERTYEEMDV